MYFSIPAKRQILGKHPPTKFQGGKVPASIMYGASAPMGQNYDRVVFKPSWTFTWDTMVYSTWEQYFGYLHHLV